MGLRPKPSVCKADVRARVSIKSIPVSILGVSGFAGSEPARLVAAHPALELVGVAADRWHGKVLGDCMRLAGPAERLRVSAMDDAPKLAGQSALVALATPAEASMKLAPELLRAGVKVVDLSGAFRLTDIDAYPRWYQFDHSAPEIVAEAHYGLPEVQEASGNAESITKARIVANPGCYATAAIVALAPLLRAGIVSPEGLFLDGKSGVSGAGRKVEERYSFMEVVENVSPYRVGDHQHTPEIEQALGRVAKAPVTVTFVPHLLPIKRGLIVTAYARLCRDVVPADVETLFRNAYDGAESLVEVTSPGHVSISRVAYTPFGSVGVRVLPERSSVVVVSALDNLLKGAASQAMQNLCAMIGVSPGFSRGNP
jgi:N-acetyl-gamma-glutamyl-phosphate reductase